jgi:abortive infection bacteriophage resistance protein
MRFDKASKTINEQIELLRSRGMIITDQSEAQHYLAHLNYYRISSYWLPFEDNHQTHHFRPNTNFKDILNLYIFDRELRLLVLGAIERIEVSWRSQWAYEMAQKYGSHSYMDDNLAMNKNHWQTNFDELIKEINRSQEIFIKHYLNKYNNPPLPPIWAVCEVMSMGLLSRWYKNLKPMAVRKSISKKYQLDNKILASFMYHLSEVRNVCAHHSRL